MGEILSRDVTLLTCRQKIIVKVNIMGRSCHVMYVTNMLAKYNSESEYYGGDLVT